jgi:hypothetical protein
LGQSGCTSNDPGNVNGFAASFENESGKTVGTLRAAFGDATNCAQRAPDPFPDVSSWTYGDCHAVMGRNQSGGGPPVWTFTWVAPSDGSNVTMYYGVVDGDCMMDSMGDDVRVGVKKLGAGVALRDAGSRPAGNGWLAFAGVLPAVAIAGAARKSARRSRTR